MAELKRCKKCGKISSWNSHFNGYMCECGNIERETMTNADRIRAMSDEELAKECVRQFPMYLWPTEVRTIYFDFENHNKNNAINAWLQWLEQPAEE